MSFKQIGTLAGQVLLKAERTARRRALRLDGGPTMGGVPVEPPTLGSTRATASSEGKGKDGGSLATPASPDLGGQKTRRNVMPRFQLVAVNDKIETSIGMRGIRPRGFPASLPRSPVLVVSELRH